MCRSIRTLFNFDPPANDDEIRAAARQFVRKLSGFAHPSRANQAAFEAAVAEVADSARRLMASLTTHQICRPDRAGHIRKEILSETPVGHCVSRFCLALS